MKKPRVIFVIATDDLKWQLDMFVNSLRKFHTEKELPLVVIDQKRLDKVKDPHKFYRGAPMFARELIKEYDLVIKADIDQIVTGKLDYIFNVKYDNYDVGTVYNWNRVDPAMYGEVGFGTIHPLEYYNCGLVALRSERFIENWWRLCNSPHFDRMPMREQGFLNILCHYGDYRVRCFDDYNPILEESSWYGLRSKGEWNRVQLKGGELILPMSPDGYPEQPKKIRMIHWAGGSTGPKMNYKIFFNDEVSAYLDSLVGTNAKEK